MNSHTFVAFLCFLLIIPVCSLGVPIPEDVQIITEEYPPMNYVENGTLQGISVDLVEEIFHRLGSDINRSSFQVLPWHEGYNQTLYTKDTLLFSTSRLPEREEQFLWAGPIAMDKKAFFMLKGSKIPDKTTIGTLRIATVEHDSGEGCAIAAGADPRLITRCPSAKEAIQLVEGGSVDAFAYNILAGQKAVEKYAKEPSMFVTGMDIGEVENYIACNPETSNEFVRALNDTISEIKRDRLNTGFTVYEEIQARYLPVQCTDISTTSEQVTDLVNRTAIDIENNAPETIRAINEGLNPYVTNDNPDLYVFVFDTQVNLVANPINPLIVGKNLSGTTDILGRPFRDELVTGAIQNGTGWVFYTYSNPTSLGLYKKTSYFQLVTGSDGVEYVVGSGRYLTCDEI